MKNISKEYLVLFNTITDAESALEALRQKLIVAQQLAEELYISEYENPSPDPVHNLSEMAS